MNKIQKYILSGLLGLIVFAPIVFAASSPVFMKKVGDDIIPLQSNYDFGSVSDPWEEGHFTNLNATSLAIGGLVVGNLDLDGNKIIFDDDQDTYAQASGDDQIDWTINGAIDFVFGSNALVVADGSTLDVNVIAETTLGHGIQFLNDILFANSETINNAVDGILTLLGAGGINNENLSIDLESTTDQINFSSSTGVTRFNFDPIWLNAWLYTETIRSESATLDVGSTGAVNNENLVFDFETSANTVGVTSDTAVSLVDFGSINLGVNALDVSDNDITNIGDVSLDSITADGTTIIMRNLGDTNNEALTWDFETVANNVGVSSSTGVSLIDYGLIGLDINSLDVSDNDIANVGNISLDSISADNITGHIILKNIGGTNNEDLNFDLETTANTVALSSSTGVNKLSLGLLSLDSNVLTDSILSDAGLILGGVGGTNNESLTFNFEALANIIGVSTTTGATDLTLTGIDINTTTEVSAENIVSTDDVDITDNLTVGDVIIDEATGVLAFSGATSASILTTGSQNNLILGGANQTNNENLIFNFETVANIVGISSNTGVTTIDLDPALHLSGAIWSSALTVPGGSLAISGAVGTNNENLTFNFESVANTVGVTSTTGVLDLTYTGIDLNSTTEISAENLISTDDADITDNLTAGDITIDEATGVLAFSGATSASILTTNAGMNTLTLGGAGQTNNENLTLDFESVPNMIGINSSTGVTTIDINPAIALNAKINTTSINIPSGILTFTGVAGINNESLVFDFETTSNQIGVSSSTGATTIDYGSINLGVNGLDLSENNITNVGDIGLDSITADGTTILMQNTGDTNNENLTWNFEATPNTVGVSTSSGVDTIDFGTILLVAPIGSTDISFAGGSIKIHGVGGSNNEALDWNFESVANNVGISSATGVTTVDFGSLNLGANGVDVSDNNITNVGSIQLDTLLTDGTTLEMQGANGTYNEDLIWNFDGGLNLISVTTGTGTGTIDFGNIDLQTDELWIDSSILATPSGDTLITAVGGITMTNPIQRVAGNGGAINITADPQVQSGLDGQIVIIQGTHGTNTVQLDDGAGLALAGGASIILGQGDNIMLMFDGGDDIWYEVSRSDN